MYLYMTEWQNKISMVTRKNVNFKVTVTVSGLKLYIINIIYAAGR